MTVAIVGGGLAGLFTATRLVDSGHDDVVVLEAGAQPGGVVCSVSRDGFILEPGAGSFTLPHPHLSALLASSEVRAADPAARRRHVWIGDRLVALRPGPAAVLAPVVPLRAKLRGVLEPLVTELPRGDDDESLETFCRRRFGNELGRTVAWLAASGVFAGDPARLSARAAFPALAALVDAEGSVVRGALGRMRARPAGAVRPSAHVPATTMSDLAAGLADRLGHRFRSGHTVTAVRRTGPGWTLEGSDRVTADQVVVACHPAAAARLLDGVLAGSLRTSKSAPVVVVGLGGPRSNMPIPSGFGILAGPAAGTATRGILLESSYAPHRAPADHTLVKVIAGGAPHHALVDADDAAIVEAIGHEAARILGTDLDATFSAVIRHTPGIPQYDVGHFRWLREVESAAPDSLHFVGWGYRGVGVAHLATDAFRVAEAIVR